jgi:hypothetical protein
MTLSTQIFKYGSKFAKTSISSNNCFDISSVVPTFIPVILEVISSGLLQSQKNNLSCDRGKALFKCLPIKVSNFDFQEILNSKFQTGGKRHRSVT